MITKNTDPNIYCDYCKNNYRRQDGSFNAYVRPAIIKIAYIRWKGQAQSRFLCAVCVKDITELTSGYYSLHDQLLDAHNRWAVKLDV
jgi:transposase-like protein